MLIELLDEPFEEPLAAPEPPADPLLEFAPAGVIGVVWPELKPPTSLAMLLE